MSKKSAEILFMLTTMGPDMRNVCEVGIDNGGQINTLTELAADKKR